MYRNVAGYDPDVDNSYKTGRGNTPGATRGAHTFGYVGPDQTPLEMDPAVWYEYNVTSGEDAKDRVMYFAGPIGEHISLVIPIEHRCKPFH